jgi:hypothetical protein
VSSTSDGRQGVGHRDPDGDTPDWREDSIRFRGLMNPIAQEIARQPTPGLMRAKASRIAAAVIATGADLAEGKPNRWEGP